MRFNLPYAAAVLFGFLAFVPAPAQTNLAPIVVTAAPLGKFGFGTGTGGPIWRSTIGHLVINAIEPGGPAEKVGLHKGDEILTIDGLTVPGRARSEVFTTLRNVSAGQVVTFEVAGSEGKAPKRKVKVQAVAKE